MKKINTDSLRSTSKDDLVESYSEQITATEDSKLDALIQLKDDIQKVKLSDLKWLYRLLLGVELKEVNDQALDEIILAMIDNNLI